MLPDPRRGTALRANQDANRCRRMLDPVAERPIELRRNTGRGDKLEPRDNREQRDTPRNA
jgi:hypothetical protein